MKTLIRILIILSALCLLLGIITGVTRTEFLSTMASTRGFFDLSIASSLLSIALSTGHPFGKAEP